MESHAAHEGGFSLVEVILAMLLLTLIAIGILPMLIGATQASSSNRDLVAANQLAQEHLAAVRAKYPDTAENKCSIVAAESTTGSAGPDGSDIVVDVTVSACPADPDDYPTTVRVSATVRENTAATNPMTVVPTEILVTIP